MKYLFTFDPEQQSDLQQAMPQCRWQGGINDTAGTGKRASPAEKWVRMRRQKNPLRVLRGQHEEETSGRGYQLDASRG
jgi:hypothetical protein